MVTLLKKDNNDSPLNADQVSKLRSLRAKAKPPYKVTLNMDTFRLPEGAKASLVKVKGASGTFRIQAAYTWKNSRASYHV